MLFVNDGGHRLEIGQMRRLRLLCVIGSTSRGLRFAMTLRKMRTSKFLATDPEGRPVVVARLRGDEAFITLGARLSVSPDAKAMLEEMPESVRLGMIEEIKIELARFGISYEITEPLETIRVADHVLCDDTLTRFVLAERVGFVRRALVLIMVLLGRAVRISQEQKQQGGYPTIE